jgi:hypothetical protein
VANCGATASANAVFIDGTGASLDKGILFNTATVTINPEAVPQISIRRSSGDRSSCFTEMDPKIKTSS